MRCAKLNRVAAHEGCKVSVDSVSQVNRSLGSKFSSVCGITCMSVSALIVDGAHGVLLQQEFDHFEIFSVGACTVI